MSEMDKERQEGDQITEESGQGAPISEGQTDLFGDAEMLHLSTTINYSKEAEQDALKEMLKCFVEGLDPERRRILMTQGNILKGFDDAIKVDNGESFSYEIQRRLLPKIKVFKVFVDQLDALMTEEELKEIEGTGNMGFHRRYFAWMKTKGAEIIWSSELKDYLAIINKALISGEGALFRIHEDVLYPLTAFDEAGQLIPKTQGIEHFEVLEELEERIEAEVKKRLKTEKKKAKARDRTYRGSGHLGDLILKNDQEEPLTLFDKLKESTKEAMQPGYLKIKKQEKQEMVIDWDNDFTDEELDIIEVMEELLHDKSSRDNKADRKAYYSGNGREITSKDAAYLGEIIPTIKLTLHEITKKRISHERPGGSAQKDTLKIIEAMSLKRRLVRYETTEYSYDKKTGTRVKKRWTERETYMPILFLVKAKEGEFTEEGEKVTTRQEIEIALHPIFRDQIESKWIEKPRMELRAEAWAEASGSKRATDQPQLYKLLNLELCRARSNRRTFYEIGEEKLFKKIAPKFMPPYRKRLPYIKEQLTLAVQALIIVGLVTEHKTRAGATGETVHVFNFGDFKKGKKELKTGKTEP